MEPLETDGSQNENPITVEKKEYQDIEQYCARSHFVRDDMARRQTPAAEFKISPPRSAN
jgi:hypothetical protein